MSDSQGVYRYTPRGTTWKPCPACGQEPHSSYKIGSVCAECRHLLDWSKAEHERYTRLSDLVIRVIPEAHRMDLPYYPGSSSQTKDPEGYFDKARRALGEAIYGVLDALLAATGGAAEIYQHINRNPQGYVIHHATTVPRGADSPYPTDHRYVLLRREHAEAFDNLGPVLGVMIQAAYASGVIDGKDLLNQLASGQLTNDQFNEVDVRMAKRIQDAAGRVKRLNERADA